jgi:ribosomal protein RSM22 (predicted rRNA methylase)
MNGLWRLFCRVRSARSIHLSTLSKSEGYAFEPINGGNCRGISHRRSGYTGPSGLEMKVNDEDDGIVRYKPAITEEYDLKARLIVDPSTGEEELVEEDIDDIHEEEESLETRAGKKILKLSRIRYRHIENKVPSWFTSKQKEIAQNRTLSQVRRCLKSWMIKNDMETMKSYLYKPFHFKKETKQSLTSSKNNRIRYVYGPDETIAYSYYHLPNRFVITTRLLEELKSIYTKDQFTPKRILDFGCGPGTVAAAVQNVWGEEDEDDSEEEKKEEERTPDRRQQWKENEIKDSFSSRTASSMSRSPPPLSSSPSPKKKKRLMTTYVGLEVSQSMIDAAKIMTKDIFPNSIFYNKTSDLLTRCIEKNERFDLIVASYTISELSNEEAKRVAVQLLFELLEPNGYLILLENGNPMGSHLIRTARQYLLHMMNTITKDGEFEQYYDESYQVPEKIAKKLAAKAEEAKEKEKEKDKEKEDDGEGLEEKQKDSEFFQQMKQYKEKRHAITTGQERSMILQAPKSYRHTDFKAHIIAPCTHDGLCPMNKDSFCSFSQRVTSSTLRKDMEEKYSYVILQKKSIKPKTKKQIQEEGPEEDSWVSYKNTDLSFLPELNDAESLLNATPLDIVNTFTKLTEQRKTGEMKKIVDTIEKVSSIVLFVSCEFFMFHAFLLFDIPLCFSLDGLG